MGSLPTVRMVPGHLSLLLLSASWASLGLSADPSNDDRRMGKFFVSTSTYTSVVTTNDNCYVALSSTSSLMMACKKRRKSLRYLNEHVINPIVYPISPSPSNSEQNNKSRQPSSEEISSSYADARAARFLYYWATYTETSTSYSYTTTSTIASLFCTPPGYTVVPCTGQMGGKKKRR